MEVGAAVWVKDTDLNWISSTIISKVCTFGSAPKLFSCDLKILNIAKTVGQR